MEARGRGRSLTRPAWMKDDELGEDWCEAKAGDGRTYWYHRVTQQTTWERPSRKRAGEAIVGDEMVHATQGKRQRRLLDAGWREANTADGKVYYYNEVTKQTSWTMPGSPDARESGDAIEAGRFADAPETVDDGADVMKEAVQDMRLRYTPTPPNGSLVADDQGQAYRENGTSAAQASHEIENVLPTGWKQFVDGQGRKYYYHIDSGETQWDPPIAEVPQINSLPVGWEVATTSNGSKYYVHRESGQTSWNPPLDSSEAGQLNIAKQDPPTTGRDRRPKKPPKGNTISTRPRKPDGLPMGDREAEFHFLEEARKTKKFQQAIPKPLGDTLKAQLQFRSMLADFNVTSKHSWLDAIQICAHDSRYLGSVRTYGERKHAYQVYKAQLLKRERIDAILTHRRKIEEFYSMLDEYLKQEDDGARSLQDCREPAVRRIEADERYLSITEDMQRGDLLSFYFTTRQRARKEAKRRARQAKMEALRTKIEVLADEKVPRLKERISLRELADILKDESEFKALGSADSDVVLEQWQRDAERLAAEKLAREREERKAAEKEHRIRFRRGVESMLRERRIPLRSNWREAAGTVEAEDWARSDLIRSRYPEIFIDVVTEVEARCKGYRDRLRKVAKELKFEFRPESSVEEFLQLPDVRGKLGEALPEDWIPVVFLDTRDKTIERKEKEIQAVKKDFHELLERKEFGLDSKWKEVKVSWYFTSSMCCSEGGHSRPVMLLQLSRVLFMFLSGLSILILDTCIISSTPLPFYSKVPGYPGITDSLIVF
uniref:WW domain-containing protein n=1 Tax=Compsopogon caeruleus TaxID=31354 RepID=A0A7S1XEM8_9RHOD